MVIKSHDRFLNPLVYEGIEYPSSDGQPMAEDTTQFIYIVLIKEELETLYEEDQNVFVAGDLLWYPVQGDPDIKAAPDTMVVFGRPKGDRRSYMQFIENNIPPQVVFEILSHSNRPAEMERKFEFYEQYGVEEYYIYDPHRGTLQGFLGGGGQLEPIPDMLGWVSPRLEIRFEMQGDELRLFYPDGTPFRRLGEMKRLYREAEQRAEAERQRAEQEKQRAENEQGQKERAHQRIEKLEERLRAMGIDPDEENGA